MSEKNVAFARYGDKLEVIIRDSCYNKTYQNEVNTNDKKSMEKIIIRLKEQRR